MLKMGLRAPLWSLEQTVKLKNYWELDFHAQADNTNLEIPKLKLKFKFGIQSLKTCTLVYKHGEPLYNLVKHSQLKNHLFKIMSQLPNLVLIHFLHIKPNPNPE